MVCIFLYYTSKDNSITNELEEITINHHKSVSLACYGSSISWTFNNGKIPGNILQDNQILVIVQAQENNGGIYECESKTNDQVTFARIVVKIKVMYHYFITVSLSVYLSICPLVVMSACPVCLSCLSVCPVCLTVCLAVLSVCLSVCLSVLSVCMSVLSVCLYVLSVLSVSLSCLSVCPVCFSVCPV